MQSPAWLLLVGGGAALLEVYFFLMQRSALEIGRASDVDAHTTRYMLPLWYALVWPAKLVKWIAAFLLWRSGDLFVALAILIVAWLLMMILPVPHRHFVPMFQHKVTGDMGTASEAIAAKLLVALLRSNN